MKQLFLFLTSISLFALLQGCQSNEDIPVSKEPQMLKLAAPILVSSDSTVIELSDYLLKPSWIDSLYIDPSLKATISTDSSQIVIKPIERDFPKLSVLKIWSKGFSYSLLLEKSTKLKYRFTFDPKNKKYKRVQIKGQMNLSPLPLVVLSPSKMSWHLLHFPVSQEFNSSYGVNTFNSLCMPNT